MNRFHVMPCIDRTEINECSHKGLVLPLASEIQNNCVLFFPVSDEVGSLINYLLEAEKTDDQQLNMIAVFKTMISTWRDGGRFLSGIFIDKIYDEKSEEDIINVNLILSSTSDGFVEAVVNINFIHSIIIAALEGVDIMISDALLTKLLPEELNEEESDEESDEKDDQLDNQLDKKSYPVDENILNIAKRIMNGKIK